MAEVTLPPQLSERLAQVAHDRKEKSREKRRELSTRIMCGLIGIVWVVLPALLSADPLILFLCMAVSYVPYLVLRLQKMALRRDRRDVDKAIELAKFDGTSEDGLEKLRGHRRWIISEREHNHTYRGLALYFAIGALLSGALYFFYLGFSARGY